MNLSRARQLTYYALIGYAVSAGNSISLSQTCLALAFLGVLYEWRVTGRFPCAGFEPAYAAFAVASILSIPQAFNVSKAIVEARELLLIFVFSVAFGAALSTEKRRIIAGCLVAGSAVANAAAIIQICFITKFAKRAKGFFASSLTFSECQMIFFLFTLSWLAMRKESKRVQTLLFAALLLQAGGFWVSFTRGAVIGLILGVFILFGRNLKAFAVACCISALIIAGFVPMSKLIRHRHDAFSFSKTSDGSLNNYRLKIWSIGMSIVKKQPIFGLGLNNVEYHYEHWLKTFGHRKEPVWGHLHNTFLQILGTSGILGLVTFVWFWLALARWCVEVSAASMPEWEQGMSQAALPILAAFLAAGMTEHIYGDEEVAMLLLFSIGLLSNAYRCQASAETEPARLPVESIEKTA